jgi:hypothetical protein
MSTDNPIVIDLGSESVKAGYAQAVPSEQEPRIVTPSLVRVQPRGAAGCQAAAAANGSSSSSGRLVRVVERGAVRSMDCLDAMLHHLFYDQLGWVKGEEGAVLFVEPLFVGKGERELLTQLMFEGFNVAGLFLHDAASLSLAAAGKLNGCSVDIGHGKIDIATVSEGVMHAPGAVRMSFAGEQLTQVRARGEGGRELWWCREQLARRSAHSSRVIGWGWWLGWLQCAVWDEAMPAAQHSMLAATFASSSQPMRCPTLRPLCCRRAPGAGAVPGAAAAGAAAAVAAAAECAQGAVLSSSAQRRGLFSHAGSAAAPLPEAAQKPRTGSSSSSRS